MRSGSALGTTISRWLAVPCIVSLLFVACSPGAVPVSQSQHDPSNPAAPEGVTPALPTMVVHVAAPPARRADAHAGHGGTAAAPSPPLADAGSAVYVCPMHPQSTSTQPGSCAICGMGLVPGN